MNKYTIEEVLSFSEESINQKVPKSKSFDMSFITKQGDVFFIEIKSGADSEPESFSALYKDNLTTQNYQTVFNKIIYSNKYNLLVTNKLGDALVDKAVNEGVEFFDMAGNMHLEISNNFFLLSGNKLRQDLAIKSLRSEIHFAWQKVIFYILNFPESLHFSLRSLAEHANVSHSSIQQLETFLKRNVYLTIHDGKKILHRKLDLFNLWIENYSNKLSDKVSFGKFKIHEDLCAELINNSGEDYLLSGSSALSIFNNQIGIKDFIVYSNDLDSFTNKYSLKRDPDGNVELRKRFWNDFNSTNPYGIVPILLFVADLMNSNDEKARKTGTQFFDEHLAYVLKEPNEYSLQNYMKYFKELV
ncbi:MAG: type IV toxin-antitoxin system AbiEi family antitoxin [Parachlamydiaceae bacterium]|nr:type IV toxin-antitoxin system AbiEi family antitoxin [Parachlamydiaceae bacterium]